MVTDQHSAEQTVQQSTEPTRHRAERVGHAIPDAKLAEIIAAQEEIFVRRQPNSAHLAQAAQQHLAGGVTSSWQITAPQPVWLSHGHGSKVYDVDGNEYVDLHGGYGAALAGHAHPAIQHAIATQVAKGTHFAQPTPNAVAVARELARRFGLPRWRFANSGTEATMDAVHLMRSITGRDLIIKIEGCYHGHHDSVQVSVMPDPEDAGPQNKPNSAPSSTGIPRAITDLTLIATFNDLGSVARLLDEHKNQIAGLIIEPIMMNAGIIKPEPGYLASLKALLHEHGALLTFDEVKTGLTVGPGGVTAQQQVKPDLITLAKSLGGGVSVAAIGGTEAVMDHVASGGYEMVGTFNGNPLALAATRAMLTEVATPEAYRADRNAARTRANRHRAGHRSLKPDRARGHRGRQGLRGVLRRTGHQTTAASSAWTTGTATRTGSTSTTAASSSRPGARSSSG